MVQNYELNIISVEKNKKLKKYNLNNIDTIGVFENEQFLIEFKNHTWDRVQVRLSIDGTDMLTGKEASLEPFGEMWIVEPMQSIKLKAWPEGMKGGASLLFGEAASSVAANTHGNMSSQGIIAAAVFVEGKPTVNWETITYSYPTDNWYDPTLFRSSSSSNVILRSKQLKMEQICDSSNFNPAVGAGEYVEQKLTKVAGLNQPVYKETVLVKYKWWTELRSSLRKLSTKSDVPGFPAEQNKLIDLGKTPRKIKKKSPFPFRYNKAI